MDMMLLGGPPLLSGRLSGLSFQSEDTGFVLVPPQECLRSSTRYAGS